jgi:hypothetical protein
VPDSFTDNFITACLGAIQSDSCGFTAKGMGRYSLAALGKGAKSDVAVSAQLSGVANCDGATLHLVADFRSTADDCNGVSCTTVDVTGFPLGSCTVARGKCSIKTTLNTLAAATVLGGEKTAFTILGIRVVHGATTAFEGGLLVP